VVANLVAIALVVAIPGIWVSALVSASRTADGAFKHAGRSKVSDIVLIAITSFVGGLYWWIVIRRQVKPHHAAQPKSFA
jgi:uncharacterized membrane protein YkgB